MTGQWFSADTPVFFTNKTDRHHITEKHEQHGDVTKKLGFPASYKSSLYAFNLMLGFDYIRNRSVDRFHFYEISLQKSIHQMHNELLIYRESNFMYGSYTIGVDERNFISVVLID